MHDWRRNGRFDSEEKNYFPNHKQRGCDCRSGGHGIRLGAVAPPTNSMRWIHERISGPTSCIAERQEANGRSHITPLLRDGCPVAFHGVPDFLRPDVTTPRDCPLGGFGLPRVNTKSLNRLPQIARKTKQLIKPHLRIPVALSTTPSHIPILPCFGPSKSQDARQIPLQQRRFPQRPRLG